MRVLGIDPGLIRLGLGALDHTDDQTTLITYGLIANPRGQESYNDFIDSGIHQIVNDFPRLLDLVQPHIIVAEMVPPGRLGSNSDSVMAAITTCKVIAYQFGIPWSRIAASTVKKQITGDAKASKAKIKNAVMDEFGTIKARHAELKREQKLEGVKASGLPADVFDAIAIAWTHIQQEKQKKHDTEADGST